MNKQQQYLSAIQDPNQQYNYSNQKSEGGITGWMTNLWNSSSNNVIKKKVDVNSGGFFSKKVFTNNLWQQ